MNEVKKKAFLAEDSPIQAKAAKRILNSMGYEVDHTTTGEDAVEMFRHNHYDFAIFDIGLDGALSGDQAVEKIRQLDLGRNCPIFAVTAHVSEDSLERYKQAGINKVFEKPIRKDEIMAAYAEFKEAVNKFM